MTRLRRREALLAIAASTSTAVIAGCERGNIDEVIQNTSTDTLETTRLSLRGFQIVAFTVGRRVVQLPHPAVRILGVALLTSGIVTFLVVEYLDVELKKRSIREALDDQERADLEANLAVEFQTENGFTESVVLGPNQYE